MSGSPSLLTSNAPLFIADHGALDFVNTVAQVEGQPRDFWQSGEDVQHWLTHAGLATLPDRLPFPAGELLQEARRLREVIRRLVMQKKAGEAVDVTALNRYLA